MNCPDCGAQLRQVGSEHEFKCSGCKGDFKQLELLTGIEKGQALLITPNPRRRGPYKKKG